VDWGRQLYQVEEWEDRHPREECWFAYTVRPFIHPETYGVHCHILPNGLGGSGPEAVPPNPWKRTAQRRRSRRQPLAEPGDESLSRISDDETG
jgi:hypothetical protein